MSKETYYSVKRDLLQEMSDTGYMQVYDESVTESSQLADKVLCM